MATCVAIIWHAHSASRVLGGAALFGANAKNAGKGTAPRFPAPGRPNRQFSQYTEKLSPFDWRPNAVQTATVQRERGNWMWSGAAEGRAVGARVTAPITAATWPAWTSP